MNKDILGEELYNVRNIFSNKTMKELEEVYGSIEGARIAACKAEAEAIIQHIQQYAKPLVPGTGLVAPTGGGPVTGESITGSIE